MKDDTTSSGVVEASFVRREYYLEPPAKGSTPEVWAAWLEADKLAAAQAKRAFTRSQKHAEIPDYLAPKVVSKVGGVYRQSAMVGFVGDGDGSRIEAAIDASQEREIILARQQSDQGKRGTKSKNKNARYEANAKAKARADRARRFSKGQN